ncbi:MAG: hypothetical protein WAV16_00510 [Candidatus Moraniibacteriota bacterium]
MITLNLAHLFKTNPDSIKVPKIVFDWVTEKEKQFTDIEFQISFFNYKSEESRRLGLNNERIYGPSLPRLRSVSFPLNDGYWSVKLIGDQRTAIDASGLLDILGNKDPRIQIIEDNGNTLRAYTRINPIMAAEEELVDIRCDRNMNDEWEFRGTGEEFINEKLNF